MAKKQISRPLPPVFRSPQTDHVLPVQSSAPYLAAIPPARDVTPVTIRLPKRGTQCPYSGLTRAHMGQLVASGAIESVSLREPGRSRGVRLIFFDSLMAYIRRHKAGGAA